MVVVEEFHEVRGGLAPEEKNFKSNPLRDREPVEAPEDGCDVLAGAGVGEQTYAVFVHLDRQQAGSENKNQGR